MGRVVGLCLLGLAAWLVTVVVRFPAAPLVERLRPGLGPVALDGVDGALVDGRVARLRSTDDLLPLELSDVRWTLAPGALVQGAGADVSFAGYGGGGQGRVLRAWNGDIVVDDLTFTAEAKALEPLLPVPIASFSGELAGDVARVVLEEGLLATFEGSFTWTEALLETPVRAALGTVDVSVEQLSAEEHVARLSASGGDVAAEGSVSVARDGDFVADVLLTPSASAPPDLVAAIGRIARPESGGRFRLRQTGNVNRPI